MAGTFVGKIGKGLVNKEIEQERYPDHPSPHTFAGTREVKESGNKKPREIDLTIDEKKCGAD